MPADRTLVSIDVTAFWRPALPPAALCATAVAMAPSSDPCWSLVSDAEPPCSAPTSSLPTADAISCCAVAFVLAAISAPRLPATCVAASASATLPASATWLPIAAPRSAGRDTLNTAVALATS